MKKRIAAVALAVVMIFNIVGDNTRARAEPVTLITITTLGILAWQLLNVMNGSYDDEADAIAWILENGVEGFEKAFIADGDHPSWMAQGWSQIFDELTRWAEAYKITVDEHGNLRMSYSQYLELYDLVGQNYVDFDINLGSSIDYQIFKYETDRWLFLYTSPCIDSFYNSPTGMSYVPVFYDSEKIYFCANYFYTNAYIAEGDEKYSFYSASRFTEFAPLQYWQPYVISFGNIELKSDVILKNYLYDYKYHVCYDSLNYTFDCTVAAEFQWDALVEKSADVKGFACYDGSQLINIESPLDEIDFSSLNFGYTNVYGDATDFYRSIQYYQAEEVYTIDIDDLSEPLEDILDQTNDPTLVIDTDPDITNPIHAITISDIPGQADIPLADLLTDVDLDIDVPSVLATKFPFCIPFDFIRILSVLCAEPKAPVFVIPLSTDPDNLKGFEGNQTIGEIPEDFKPLFEIDEEIIIDLSVIPLVQPVCYTIFIIGFAVMLIMITSKMINH